MFVNDNRVTYGTKLSDRIWQDSNGQLICRDAVIARTGSQKYLESEIIEDGDPSKVVNVFRTEEEVFDPISVASFEDKPLTLDHPQEDVSLDNYRDLAKGYIRNVKRGTGELSNCLICDIVVTDQDTIDLIKSGQKRELSGGYTADIINRGGTYVMTNIRGNHLALVDSGRAGCATIRDSQNKIIEGGNKTMLKKSKVSLFDDDIFEVEEIVESPMGEEVVDEEMPATGDQHTINECFNAIVALTEMVKELAEKQGVVDCELPQPAKLVAEDDDELVEGVVSPEAGETTGEEIEEREGELLDADDLLSKEENKVVNAKDTYAKFAKVGDTRENVLKSEVTKAFQSRYDRAAGISK